VDVPETDLFFILLIIIFFINSFFILLRTALVESHKSQLEKNLNNNDIRLEKAAVIIDETDNLLTGFSICTICLNFFIGIITFFATIPYFYYLMEKLPIKFTYSYELAFLLGAIITLFIDILFANHLPKKIAQIKPEFYIIHNLSFLVIFNKVIQPPIIFLSYAVNFILMITGSNPPDNDSVTEDEVKDLIERGTEEGTFEKAEQDMVDSIFHMSDQTAYSLMTPRTQIIWLDIEDDLITNLNVIRKNPHELFLIGRDDLDNLLGIIYTKDILNAALSNDLCDLAKFVKKPIFVPRSMETFRVLEKFRDNNIHEAVVVDEYGGVVGLITLKDIVEEIIGDISSVEEKEAVQIIQRTETSWYIDGLYDIDDFKEKFDIEELPGEERGHYKTIGGFLTSYFGYIPKTAEYKIWQNLKFEVVDMDRTRIDKILITKLDNY